MRGIVGIARMEIVHGLQTGPGTAVQALPVRLRVGGIHSRQMDCRRFGGLRIRHFAFRSTHSMGSTSTGNEKVTSIEKTPRIRSLPQMSPGTQQPRRLKPQQCLCKRDIELAFGLCVPAEHDDQMISLPTRIEMMTGP